MTCGGSSPRLAEGAALAASAREGTIGGLLGQAPGGIAASCFPPVRVGVVESLNTTINAVIHRARGMRDEAMRLVNLKWATAHPIRSARDLKRFLQPSERPSNR
jgi:hypothetical protein